MIRIANAPCSWGILEFDRESETAEAEQMLNEMQATGYEGTELGDWGFLPTEPGMLAETLQKRNLSLLGAFVPVALTEPGAHAAGEAAALRTARLLSAVARPDPFIVLADDSGDNPVRSRNAGRIQPEHGLSRAAWEGFAGRAEQIARAVRDETGLRTVFHPHCATYVETPAEIDTLMTMTDPDLLGLCFDTGHYRYGGGDPVEGIAKHGGRIWHMHFKDCSPAVAGRARQEGWEYVQAIRHGLFCELGQGDVDFPAVIAALNEQSYDGWIVVEQDVLPGMGTPRASAQRNRDYLREIGL
ncbi:MAG: TIM barrel protein [Anaerolineae bacterium]|nr:TIM barrel protein [Anaerolineae bacterium]